MTNEYDPRSAVTFLLLGLGIGAALAVVCNPIRRSVRPENASWRSPGAPPPAWKEATGLGASLRT
jgi:hypothetical protein